MTADCNRKNPLTRSGTNQDERRLKALEPGYISLDERQTADLITFAARYSRHLRYYDTANQQDGDWLPFFSTDIAAILAGLARLPVDGFIGLAADIEEYLSADPDRAVSALSDHFKLYLFLPLLLLEEISRSQARLPGDHPLRAFIAGSGRNEIVEPLTGVLAAFKGALTLADPPLNGTPLFADTPLELADYNPLSGGDGPQLPASVAERVNPNRKLSELEITAGLLGQDWLTFYNSVAPDTGPYEDSAGAADDRVYHQVYDALNYNLLSQSLARLFQAPRRIAAEAERQLQAALADVDTHTPHYGLWLAFLKLFEINRQQLNTLTARHLDFYYQEALRLRRRPAEPNAVHLIFELNKTIPERLLAAGVLFKGGKDALGKDVTYRLQEDIVVNRAQVAELRSLYLPAGGGTTLAAFPSASTVTNSADGLGAALPDDKPGWRPFGPLQGAPTPRLGFAIADRQLFLREGERKITLLIRTGMPAAADLESGKYKIYLTGEEGWLVPDPLKITKQIADSGSEAGLKITLELPGDFPAVLPYDPAVHGEGFPLAGPMLKLEYDFSSLTAVRLARFHQLKDHDFNQIQLSVSVEGGRNFTLENELGPLDPGKAFLPFGPMPEANASLILGSSEVFCKKLNNISLVLSWETAYDANKFFTKTKASDFKAALRDLRAGLWNSTGNLAQIQIFDSTSETYKDNEIKAVSPIDEETRRIFEEGGIQFSTPQSTPNAEGQSLPLLLPLQAPPDSFDSDQDAVGLAEVDYTLAIRGDDIPNRRDVTINLSDLPNFSRLPNITPENEPYSPAARAGFIRLDLNRGFGHRKYIDEKTRALVLLAGDDGTYTSDLYNVSNGLPLEPYTPKITEITLGYTTRPDKPEHFFHLYPFGFEPRDNKSGRLFPSLPFEGELYLGVKDLAPPQRLALLFQTVDGSANPLKAMTALQWHYLRGDEWVEFADDKVDDRTHNLTGSGIVALDTPQDADAAHNLLPAGLHWFRLAAQSDADGLNDLLGIHAQAAAAVFVDQSNDPAFLAAALPPGSVTKLKAGDSAIKKVTQPYPSFGGKTAESLPAFYVRASERLRHKDRAAGMWDYERLILEHFPNVYKARCINHTELVRDLQNHILADNEVRPGSVLVVVIPYRRVTEGSSGADFRPLPYADKRTLGEVDRFLRRRISPFVHLEVQNPKFEEVQVKFKVRFTPDIADLTFYRQMLNQAIVRFLSPWTYDEGAEINFGGSWTKSSIINFIEEQPYVHFLTDFLMYHKPDIEMSDAVWNPVDEEVVEATASRSILVSHKEHHIDVLP